MPNVKFKKDFLINDLDLPYNNDLIQEDNIIDTSRWSEIHEIIFKYDNKYYKTEYYQGLTECQDEFPWEYDEEVECVEVELKEVLVKQWVKIKEEKLIRKESNIIESNMKILFFDTETSGFIKKAMSYDDSDQAWLVQIGAILSDNEGNVIDEIDCLIKANGRKINYHAEKIHGFSVERTDAEGIEELSAAEQFGLLLSQADKIVCHNLDFDWNYVYQMMQRNIDELSDDARAAFYVERERQCTMKDKRVIKFCGLKNKNGRAKRPKLIELHEIIFDCGFDGAHDAMADIIATKDCYFELVEKGVI